MRWGINARMINENNCVFIQWSFHNTEKRLTQCTYFYRDAKLNPKDVHLCWGIEKAIEYKYINKRKVSWQFIDQLGNMSTEYSRPPLKVIWLIQLWLLLLLFGKFRIKMQWHGGINWHTPSWVHKQECHDLKLLLFLLLLLLFVFCFYTESGLVISEVPPHYWETPYSQPYFDNSSRREVTATVGQAALMHCRVRNLGDRAVSDSTIRLQDLRVGVGVDVGVGVAIKMRFEQTKHYICMRVLRIRHTVYGMWIYGIWYLGYGICTYTIYIYIWYRVLQTTCGGLVADL